MLLPTLGKARDKAKAIQCKNNMKEQGLALGMYELEYGVLPAGYAGGSGKSFYWCGRLAEANLIPITTPTYWGAWSINSKILNCPSWDYKNSAGEPKPEYGLNQILPSLTGIPDNSAHENRANTFLKKDRISKPSSRMLVGESSNFVIGGAITQLGPNGGMWYPHGSTVSFHGGDYNLILPSLAKANILYLDYHVSDKTYGGMMVYEGIHMAYRQLFGHEQ